MRFAALGRTRMLHQGVRACVAAGHELVLVASAPAAPEYDVHERDFEALAKEFGCHYVDHRVLREGEGLRKVADADAEIAISVNFPTLLGREILESFPRGVLNAHAGDLPRYRGNACPNWAILQGEPRVVVTVHEMSEELDAGRIVIQRSLDLGEETYIADVYSFLNEAVPVMFAEALTGLAEGQLTPVPQSTDPALALRCLPRRPSDATINWRASAVSITRLVRASAEPFAGARTDFEGAPLTVWRARRGSADGELLGVPGQVVSVDRESGDVVVLSGDGTVILESVELGVQGRLRPDAIVRSTRQRFGTNDAGQIDALEARIRALELRLTGEEPAGPG